MVFFLFCLTLTAYMAADRINFPVKGVESGSGGRWHM